jgi:hypothetical protein
MKKKATLSLLLSLVLADNVFANSTNNDLADFIGQYQAFSKIRAQQDSEPTNARFTGDFKFKEIACINSGSTGSCDCPAGNKYLQCLTEAKAVINVDHNDIGGRGYLQIKAIMNGSQMMILRNDGQWIPAASAKNGDYSAIIPKLGNIQTVIMPVPDQEVIDNACSHGGSVTLIVGYGAVMPFDIEYANRMKAQNPGYDVNAFMLAKAKNNGYQQHKGASIGSLLCKPILAATF